jgi:hypothetical protein
LWVLIELVSWEERGLCIVVLGSKRGPKSRSDSVFRKILDWEVAKPQEERRDASLTRSETKTKEIREG